MPARRFAVAALAGSMLVTPAAATQDTERSATEPAVTADPAPVFDRVIAFFGDTRLLAVFSADVDCDTVDVADFTARLEIRTASTAFTIAEARCDGTGDSVIELHVRIVAAPVFFVSPMRFHVSLVGSVADAAGNVVAPATRSTGVTIPDRRLG